MRLEAVFGEHMTQPLARAVAPACDNDLEPALAQSPDMGGRRVEYVGVLLLPLGGEIASHPPPAIDGVLSAGGSLERRQACERLGGEPFLPLVVGEIEARMGQRLIVRLDRVGLIGGAAGGVVVGDQRDALACGLLRPRVEHEGRAGDIVEHGVEALVEERQPMLEADCPPAFADRGVKVVVARRRAEFERIGLAEAADGLGRQPCFAHRRKIERAQLANGALRLRIESADRFERIAEEVEPDRRRRPGG